jgi:hydantoinase/carbamoylase family amidase
MTGTLLDDLEALSAIGADSRGGVSRFAWTPELSHANAWLANRMREAGGDVHIDAAGNVIGRWSAGTGPAILCGSHIDTVPQGGRFDGALGVLSALEAVRTLQASGHQLSRPIWVVAFNDEEGTRFRTSMLGSRAFLGLLDLEDWQKRGVDQAMETAGFDFARLPEAAMIGDVGAYLELHIEQGPVLERARADVGIVSAITGLLGLRATFAGEANHAGTTPMRGRRDAGIGAARTIVALRDAALEDGEVMATVGSVRIEPGGANVIPGTAVIDLDLRAATPAALDRVREMARSTISRIAGEEHLTVEVQQMHRKDPAAMDPTLQQTLREAALSQGARHLDMVSGAGHDAMLMALKVPTAMLFVPSQRGISHNPSEYTSPEACELGARVLAQALAKLTGASDA